MYKNQRGFSLWSMIIVGILVLLGIVYGRHVINIQYNAYALTQKAKDVIKETGNSQDEKQILKLLRSKADFDKLSNLYEDSDVVIDRDNGNTSITITYRECASLNDAWEVCADKEISTK